MATVSRISVAPVKGFALLHPETVELTSAGVVENRRFYLADRRGRRFGNLQNGWLVRIRAEYDAAQERLRVRFPDGTDVEGDATALAEPVTTDFYGRRVCGQVVEGLWNERLSELAGQPVRLVRTLRPGDACDVHAATLVSEASLDRLSRELDTSVDGRRFRMLFTLEGCEAHEEDQWAGQAFRIGDAAVRVGGPVPRCAVTTQDPKTGEPNLDTLRGIKRYRGLRDGKKLDFGVYADVVEPGTVRVGDVVEPL